MGKITLNNIRLFGYHGCFLEEKKIGSYYTINVEIELNLDKPSISDKLSETIDYVELYYIIKKEMKINSKLIEHLSRRIIHKIKNKYKKFLIKHIKVKICKENPPIQGNKIDRICVTLYE
ncbi:dihydroneopterin aldolase [Blattabacterium cuenoti]|uniref:dihydroneopterin aldolase n=1 Tax=Blattabacterium cuenoti TaxID=1653831 RepID=UPI00163C4CEE|nr:dihydroneopterin aldolase [Blattabacterium cuenoti]